MSITIMAEIWKTSPQKGTRLLMLLAIADHANDEGIAWPSQKSLALKCRMSKRQAQNLIKDLVATEELDIEERGTGRGHSTIYRVKPASTFKGQRAKPNTTKGEIQRAKRAKSSSPEPSSLIIKDSSEEEGDFKNVVKEWERSVGPITGGIAEELGLMVDECEKHRLSIPGGSKGSAFAGEIWVVEAIMSARKSASGKFNIRYVQAILDRWIRDGFDSPFKREVEADYRSGAFADFWDA